MKASSRIAAQALGDIRDAIKAAGGGEVSFAGWLDTDGLVEQVRVASRGNMEMVLAPEGHFDGCDVVIHNHPGGLTQPSTADLRVAAAYSRDGIGSYIVDNDLEEVFVVVEPFRRRQRERLDGDALAAMLEPGGKLASVFGDFEPRPSQVAMLRLVCRAFNQDAVCVAEAGTGVGKSLAYLLPSAAWSLANDERVVVSTATINLQHQIMDRDIPLVGKLLGKEVPAVIVKGRGNYLCLTRLDEALREPELDDADMDELGHLAEWAKITASGDKSDAPQNPSDRVWSRICSEADLCSPGHCKNRDGCFVIRARREAAAARILVVNHHLLFADIVLRSRGMGYDGTAVLPPFTRIVFDEAHAIEASATSFFSETVSRFSLLRLMGRLYRSRKGSNAGTLMSLVEGAEASLAGIDDSIHQVRQLIDGLDGRTNLMPLDGSAFLLNGQTASTAAPVLDGMTSLRVQISKLVDQVQTILENLPLEKTNDAAFKEASLILTRLQGQAGLLGRFSTFDEEPQNIFWLERMNARNEQSAAFRYTATPLSIAPLMREAVWDPIASVVCTSATIAVNKSFAFWKSRLGLGQADDELLEGEFASPFDYKNRVMLAVPTGFPDPDSTSFQFDTEDFLEELLLLSGGRALVLFTSFEQLRKTFAALQPILLKAGIPAYRQGDDDRSKLLARFNAELSSVLFATDSFWEGVDAPGETLEVVVLCRLPFRVPTEPVARARRDALKRRGGNDFTEFTLPEAVLKLKQGFGRLMRRTTDRGLVCILDNRIITKSYGRMFLESLPPARRVLAPRAEIMREVAKFLARL